MIETTKLSNRLYEIEQARMALRKARDILDGIKADTEAELQEIHDSPEYRESVLKQIFGEK